MLANLVIELIMNEKIRTVLMWAARILPLACMAAALLWLLLSGRSVTVDDILSYTPSQPLLAALLTLFSTASPLVSRRTVSFS